MILIKKVQKKDIIKWSICQKENHDSHHTLPPENVESSVIVEDLIATTNGASKSFKIIAIGLGIMSVLGIIALVLKWINYSDDSTDGVMLQH